MTSAVDHGRGAIANNVRRIGCTALRWNKIGYVTISETHIGPDLNWSLAISTPHGKSSFQVV